MDHLKNLFEISKKEKKIVAGLMSGTSIDNVDVAIVEIIGHGIDTKINLLGFSEFPYPIGLKEFIIQNSNKKESNVEDISQLNFLLAEIYVNAVKSLSKKINLKLSEIDLIGSHGQTIHHLPQKRKMFSYNISSTLQLGDPSVIAKKSGIITIGDFRVGDVALGGQGAPLVPYFDYLIFRSTNKNRVLLNIGGISNLTVLQKNSKIDDVRAFDTGPGNMLIDFLVNYFFNKSFDENGEIASSGKFNSKLFNTAISMDNFIEKEPPKSTGREYYGENFLHSLLEEFKDVRGKDWLNTFTNFTAYSIYRNYEKFIKPKLKVDELIISGGGARNKFLHKCLLGYFGNKVTLKVIDEFGISADAKEAVCFAVLANETISGNPTNIPITTGAKRATILGKICLP